jgi:hypothetical protein
LFEGDRGVATAGAGIDAGHLKREPCGEGAYCLATVSVIVSDILVPQPANARRPALISVRNSPMKSEMARTLSRCSVETPRINNLIRLLLGS